MDTSQYIDVFIDESSEHVDVLSKNMLELEKNPNDSATLETIFRSAHTLKGMSATMGYMDLSNLTHQLENVFDEIRNEQLFINADLMDVLFTALDVLSEIVEGIAAGGDGKLDVTQTLERLNTLDIEGTKNDTTLTPAPEKSESHSSGIFEELDEFELAILAEASEQKLSCFEIIVTLHEECLLKGARVFMVFDVLEDYGKVIKAHPSVQELEEENFENTFSILFASDGNKEDIQSAIYNVSEIAEVYIHLVEEQPPPPIKNENDVHEASDRAKEKNTVAVQGKKRMNKTIRVKVERLDALMNLFEELVIDRGRLEQLSYELNNAELSDTVEHMNRVSKDLQDIILSLRMVPIEQVFSRFPRMIRQLARELGKKIAIDIEGADTELDRTVIDEIGDPLVHLIRNAVDHGIETPEERVKAHKPKEGILQLKAYHSGNHILIEIADDGAGIHKEKVAQKAIQNGIVNAEQITQMSDEEIFSLMMTNGFSTSEEVSDVSGRGVGLDVVKNTIESLGGNIYIHSTPGVGTTFSIQLPLSLSIISVLLIKLRNETYAIPLATIVETVIMHKRDVIYADHKEVIDFRGTIVPLIDLRDTFQVLGKKEDANESISIVVVQKGIKMTGLVVDSFIGQQEIVLKSLGKYLANVFAISGATILGNGEVALVIDSTAFIHSRGGI